jgi:hypothetical protein
MLLGLPAVGRSDRSNREALNVATRVFSTVLSDQIRV